MKRDWLIRFIWGLVVVMIISGYLTFKEQSKRLININQPLDELPEDTLYRGTTPSRIPYYSQNNGPLIYYG